MPSTGTTEAVSPGDSSGTERLRRQVQRFVRGFGLLDEDRTPCGAPVSPREAHALMILLERERAEDPPRQNQLGAELGIDKSNVTRLVQRLHANGRLQQVPSTDDGRARLLWLTAKGRRLAETIERASQARFKALLQGIPPARRTAVIAALELLNQSLAQHTQHTREADTDAQT